MFVKKIYQPFILLSLLLVTTLTFARGYDALLVLDARNSSQLPKHFRTSSDTISDESINRKGLTDLQIAGGAQFSKLSLQKILERLHTKKLTIIDLRQESHGFLNGDGISWYGDANAANAGMKPIQIENTQALLLSQLEKEQTAKVYEIIKKTSNENIAETKKIEFLVHAVSSEESLAEEEQLNYKRFYVQDFHAPTPKEVDNFVEFAKNTPKDSWIYFHCRAGVGRTTTFMALYDMMRNAKDVSLEAILARQAALGGKDLTELPEQGSFKYKAAVERLNFLKKFYQYAHDNDDNFDTTWKKWLKRHS